MDDTKLKYTVRGMIKQLLAEEENSKKKPEKKKRSASGLGIATGAVGRGRFKRFVAEAGARAQKDPAGLMEDLGVKAAAGANDIERALSVVRSAIYGNIDMGEAFSGASIAQEKTADGKVIKVIAIYPAGLNSRNALKFMSHTLHGAINAGILGLSGGMELNKGTSAPIILYEV